MHLTRFVVRSVEQLNPNHGRSDIGAERPLPFPSTFRKTRHIVRTNICDSPRLRPDAMVNPISILHFSLSSLFQLPHRSFIRGELKKTDVLQKGTVRALFQGFPTHLPVSTGAHFDLFRTNEAMNTQNNQLIFSRRFHDLGKYIYGKYILRSIWQILPRRKKELQHPFV